MSELQDNIEEIQANLAGDLLTENPASGRSFVAENRVRRDHYKGMSPAEQEAVLKEQAKHSTKPDILVAPHYLSSTHF